MSKQGRGSGTRNGRNSMPKRYFECHLANQLSANLQVHCNCTPKVSNISTSICYVLLWLLEPYGSAFTRIYKVDFDDCCYAIEMNVREHIRLCDWLRHTCRRPSCSTVPTRMRSRRSTALAATKCSVVLCSYFENGFEHDQTVRYTRALQRTISNTFSVRF
ncbi:hypothetical protein TGPRC2_300980 [Toxoplasma gondii TgCatPRC2]|uniref:Uncharacterized protein n=3 Tax=Toxoplasma gondii TaxID=5811 RepID=S7VPT2_TOXGG|nr:hypothetical protein TGME49_300980 [Toxoplasma gondii ME49]EPR57174.1 hypothetical protein TGGT1_300980 [Toxoplasma gondii GT1]EPT31343.1 hypothetical protein TGME49_300980 [Toxoplasma gondii ME49]KYK63235.1 hypothetical protein TGPRC2_300980 [Toxoplasma gondii TgCatPRC2]|eukprot:XP_018637950.1 hypothetical protein TGME49_300980 [Toxoplasma gondii ME49]